MVEKTIEVNKEVDGKLSKDNKQQALLFLEKSLNEFTEMHSKELNNLEEVKEELEKLKVDSKIITSKGLIRYCTDGLNQLTIKKKNILERIKLVHSDLSEIRNLHKLLKKSD